MDFGLLSLALIAAIVALPGIAHAQQAPSFTVVAVNPVVHTNTSTQNARFYFNVTNTGQSLDYITIQRNMMDISGPLGSGEALGISSPEFGRSLAPGASAQMMVIVQWTGLQNSQTGPVQLGNYTVSVPFRSEATGVTETLKVSVVADDNTGEYEPDTNVNITQAGHSAGTASMTQYNIQDSIWTLGASDNMSVMATAPMNHGGGATKGTGAGELGTRGAFYGIADNRVAWNYSFPSIGQRATMANASEWQATDTYISVSGDGRYAAGMDWNGWLYVFNATNGKALWSTNMSQDVNPLYPQGSEFAAGFLTSGATAFSPDGKSVAAAGSNGNLAMFNTTSGKVLWSRPFSAEVRALSFASNGNLAVGSGDWNFYMLNATTGATVWTAADHFWPFFFIAMNRNASLVGTGGKDSEFRVWNLSTGRLMFHENYTGASVGFVSGGGIANDGNFMVSMWSGGNGVYYYNSHGQLLWKHSINGAVAAMTQDGNYILVSGFNPVSENNYIYLLDNTGSVIWNYTPNTQTSCLSTISPFPRVQPKFVGLSESQDHKTLTGAVACIGGTVFYLKIPVFNTPPSAPNPNNGATGLGFGNPQQQPAQPNNGSINGPPPPCTQHCAISGNQNVTANSMTGNVAAQGPATVVPPGPQPPAGQNQSAQGATPAQSAAGFGSSGVLIIAVIALIVAVAGILAYILVARRRHI
ncbi:MAG: PQQ-like beta-propeller repeat protein [Candidatus Micrarchaeota archaeon]|nr:PQQ-like beta-propeller repeat protein [Candidatus Micrarchaeota archaeon]